MFFADDRRTMPSFPSGIIFIQAMASFLVFDTTFETNNQQSTMTKSSFPRTSRSTAAPRALSWLLLLLLQVSAFAVRQDRHLCFVRSAGVGKNTMTMTAKWMVSTMASDWDIADDSEEQKSSTVLRQRSALHLRARNNNAIAADFQQQRIGSMTPELELPRHTMAMHSRPRSLVEIAEMAMGRVAIVAAFVLVANEFVTGQSLFDQISTFATMLMMST